MKEYEGAFDLLFCEIAVYRESDEIEKELDRLNELRYQQDLGLFNFMLVTKAIISNSTELGEVMLKKYGKK